MKKPSRRVAKAAAPKEGRQATLLRKGAEERLKKHPARGPRASEPAQRRLLHELEVHRVELEIQNEELRAARLETEAGLERYAELFDFAPIAYAALSDAGAIREINHAGARLLGKDRSKLIGKAFETYLAPMSRPAFRALLNRVLVGEMKEHCDVELASNGDTPRNARLTAIRLSRGQRLIMLAFEDVTELVSTERALRETAQRKDAFLAMLSHELRNPLAPIRISLSVLSHAGVSPEQAHKARQVIDRQVTHLTRLVDDLLDVTRIVQGKIKLQQAKVELSELVRTTLEDYRTNFEAAGIRLEGPIASEPFWVNADAARLVQALSNLLGNAEKFTPRGGSVALGLERQGQEVVLRVRDTGVGIEPEVLHHVFEPFVQGAQTLDRARGGLGLGLAMVKGIVELHGGKVAISSDGPGRGTQLQVFLPIQSSKQESEAASTALPSGAVRRVLVIDDNLDTADSIRDALELNGYNVRVSYDGTQGLELAHSFNPHIVVCDLGLPGMDGYSVARALRADEALANVHLIAVSGYTRREDVERALNAGFNEHLAKPPRLDELERLIAQADDASVRPAADELVRDPTLH